MNSDEYYMIVIQDIEEDDNEEGENSADNTKNEHTDDEELYSLNPETGEMKIKQEILDEDIPHSNATDLDGVTNSEEFRNSEVLLKEVNANDEAELKFMKEEGIEVETLQENVGKQSDELVSLDEDESQLLQEFKNILLHHEYLKHGLVTEIPFIKKKNSLHCVHCEYIGKSEKEMINHYKITHNEDGLKCLACMKKFNNEVILRYHEKICDSPTAYLLRIARQLILGHEKPTKKERRSFKVKCRVCDKMICRSNIMVHLNTHTDEKHFTCTECPAKFRTKRSLSAHLNAHKGVRPFRCVQCSKAYTSDTALRQHKMDHMGEIFKCSQCDKGFSRKNSLISHMQIHTGNHKHLCTECGVSFSKASALQRHVREHLGLPPPHACTFCEKRFNLLHSLKTHMKLVHNTEILTRKMFYNKLPEMHDLDALGSSVKFVVKTEPKDGDNES